MFLKRSCSFLLFIFMFIIFSTLIEVNAVNTGFQTNQLPTEQKKTFISNIDILVIDEEPAKKSISCFDVNSNQSIAIGQSALDRKTICIYSAEGVFQYGYTFDCTGDIYVEWDEENLNIYFVRSSLILSITPDGEVLDVLEVQNTLANNSYCNHFFQSTQRTVGGTAYFIRNDFGVLNWFAPSYSQIIVKDSDGTENIIYDVGSMLLSSIIMTIIIVSVVVFIAVATIVRELIKLRHGN